MGRIFSSPIINIHTISHQASQSDDQTFHSMHALDNGSLSQIIRRCDILGQACSVLPWLLISGSMELDKQGFANPKRTQMSENKSTIRHGIHQNRSAAEQINLCCRWLVADTFWLLSPLSGCRSASDKARFLVLSMNHFTCLLPGELKG